MKQDWYDYQQKDLAACIERADAELAELAVEALRVEAYKTDLEARLALLHDRYRREQVSDDNSPLAQLHRGLVAAYAAKAVDDAGVPLVSVLADIMNTYLPGTVFIKGLALAKWMEAEGMPLKVGSKAIRRVLRAAYGYCHDYNHRTTVGAISYGRVYVVPAIKAEGLRAVLSGGDFVPARRCFACFQEVPEDQWFPVGASRFDQKHPNCPYEVSKSA